MTIGFIGLGIMGKPMTKNPFHFALDTLIKLRAKLVRAPLCATPAPTGTSS
jgi:3-hydroxyisobutyrate dehydrogenase-like beta-hydroxyacid dehydrogenase